jgi:hypothetical protein
MGANVNVTILAPDHSVKSMLDELQDGSVQAAIEAARAAYIGVDSDGNVPVVTYDEDFDNGVEVAVRTAAQTDGPDIIVLITDLVSNDREKAERLLAGSDDMFVIVPVSNQGYDEAWADKLDADEEGPNGVDVINVAGLRDPKVAMAEVGPFLDRVAA